RELLGTHVRVIDLLAIAEIDGELLEDQPAARRDRHRARETIVGDTSAEGEHVREDIAEAAAPQRMSLLRVVAQIAFDRERTEHVAKACAPGDRRFGRGWVGEVVAGERERESF